MLPERYRQLLTAYVDGEISPRQRRLLQKLLRRSPEARKLLKQMQADSHEIRALPPARLEQDLSDSVLTLIAQRQIQPARPRVAQPAPLVAGLLWPYVAAAAAILLAVAGLSYLFFASSFEPVTATGPVTKEERKPAPRNERPETPAGSPKTVVKKPPWDKPADSPRPKPEDKPNPSAAVAKDKRPVPRPLDSLKPPAALDDASTAPSLELFQFKNVAVSHPHVLKLQQLDQEAKRKGLVVELKKSNSFRLALPCANGTKVFKRVQAACKAEHIAVLIVPTAQARLRRPQLKTNYAVYMEDITPEEMARWLQRLAAEDRKAESKKKPEPQLDALVLTPMTKQDRAQLSKLLGVDPATIQPNGPLGTDLSLPLSAKTIGQVAAVLAGQGGAPRPDAAKPVVAPDRTALVLAYNPVRPNPKAPQIKRWLATRKKPRPGTLQILLVLRSTSG